MPYSTTIIRLLDKVEPPIKEVLLGILEEIERQRKQWEESVTKTEFNELKEIVADLARKVNELAEAQKKTEQRINELAEAQRKAEQRMDKLEVTVQELAEAQKRTEQRLNELAEAQKRTEQRVNELAEAQKKTEQRLNELAEAQKKTEQRLNELAEAQKKTEQRLNELAEAQKRTEQRVDRLEIAVQELAEAQKRTEEEICRLVKRMNVFEERLEGISNSVGYSLENRAYKALPEILLQRYGIKVTGRLLRRYFPVGNKNIQLNIYGHGKRDGEDVVIIGECKVRPSKKEINRFKKYAKKVADIEGKNPFYIIVAHDFPPAIEEFLRSSDIAYVWSYELE